MYTLIRENVERQVISESDRDRLIMKGFKLITSQECVQETQGPNEELENMTVEELKAYAEVNGIDLGRTTSRDGILEKIKKAE